MSRHSVTQTVSVGFLWPCVFILLFLSGNCHVCGGDRNYIDAYIRAVDKGHVS
jgi:hypothetical protein